MFELAAVARASPGTGRGGGAHREPPVKVSSAPRQEWGEPWRRGSGFRWGGGGGRSQLCSPGSPLRLGRQRERGRGGANPGGAGRGPVSAGVGSWRGWGRASHLCSRGSPLRLGTPISCAPGSPRIGIQWAQRRGADHGSGHWDCVEQGTTYSALCWHILGAPPPGGRRKASPLGSRPLPLHPSAEKSPSLRGFPKQPRVRWKSKGQNPESWLAGPALLLALCRPAGPGAPAGMGKGRVHELHPRNLVGCMDFKPWWPPRQQRRGEGILLPFHGRICGCPAAWAFSRGPCAIKVWYFGTE